MVETLKALRTFLDAKNCVFIVAADREAIEAALEEIEQSTPINRDKPYYTTASAYLDKIFQQQITLPPLRSRSLAKFARELAIDAGGLWAELAALDGEDEATPALDLVLFTLIPSHVHSPRRIKALMNSFAANVRITQSRLPGAWPERAEAIAKLTTLRTEFPDFAADLAREPRLPRYLLEAGREDSQEPDIESVRELTERWALVPREIEPVERHGSRDEVSGEGDGEVTESEAPVGTSGEARRGEDPEEPDQLVEGKGALAEGRRELEDAAARRRAARRRREELRRYLERTASGSDLSRDLFYLQSAGLDVGLEDPALAELIEADSIDSPERVIEALTGRERSELEGAARLLAALVGDVLGPEQERVMQCLMATIELLGAPPQPELARVISGALLTYWTGHTLREEHLYGALLTGLATRHFEPRLLEQLGEDERLWTTPKLVAKIVALVPELGEIDVTRLRGGLAASLGEDPAELLANYGKLDAAQRLRLLGDTDELFEALAERFHAEAEAQEAENV